MTNTAAILLSVTTTTGVKGFVGTTSLTTDRAAARRFTAADDVQAVIERQLARGFAVDVIAA